MIKRLHRAALATIAPFFAVVLSLCLLVAAAVLCFTAPMTAKAEDSEVYAHTYILGKSGTNTETEDYYTDMSAGWTAATAATGKILVKLESDWDLTAYITVASGNDITLDLNGHVIDRGLTEATSNGLVIEINGTLTVTDSKPEATHLTQGGIPMYTYEEGTADESKPYLTKTVQKALTGGIITGGYSSNTVGGVRVGKGEAAGTLTLNGGTIYGNMTENQYGGGVHVDQYSSLIMNGGAIIKNEVNYCGNNAYAAMGGGVAVYGTGAKFNLNGGLIADNVSRNTSSSGYGDATSGGVLIYGSNISIAEFNMTGGTINNNRTVSAPIRGAYSFGGAMFLQYCVTEISGGEISDNRALEVQNGVEGVYTYYSCGAAIGTMYQAQVASEKAFTFSGGLITRNMAGYGTINTYGEQLYTGGEIVNNVATIYFAGIRFNNTNSSMKISGDFACYDNYVVDSDNKIVYDSSYEMLYSNKMPYNNPQNNSHDFYVGELSEGAKRYITVYDWAINRDVGLSLDYTENNSKVYAFNGEEYKIPVNPNKYFESGRPSSSVETVNTKAYEDTTLGANGVGKIVLNSEGEIAFANSDHLAQGIVFTVTYIDGATGNEKTETFDYDTCDYYGIALTYGDIVKSIKFSGEELDISDIAGAGMYEFKGRIGTDAEAHCDNYVTVSSSGKETITYFDKITELKTIFRVVVQPKEITESDNAFEAAFDDVPYTGNEQAPEPTSVTYNNAELVKGEDYTLSYNNNVNAGDKAEAVFTFKGNYSGTVTKYFTITASTEHEYALNWQYLDGSDWVSSNSGFVYDGTDQSGKVRAVLKINDAVSAYVYAENVTEQNTTNMYLQISGTFGSDNVDRLLNAAEYTVTVAGFGDYSLPENTSVTVTIAPKTIKFDPSEFNYKDADDARLWQLDFGGYTSELRDAVTYIVDGQPVTGNETDAYARFRNTQLTIRLNPNYIYNGNPLSYYINNATCEYSNDSATGVQNKVTDMNTAVKFVFNGNFTVDGVANNTVTLNKIWHIVTINNGLLNSDDDSAASLPAFAYGETTNVQPFKPEHGDTVYFTVRKNTDDVARFAVIYNGNVKEYRLFDGDYVPGDVMPDTDYFASVINSLDAGNYQLYAHVKEFTDTDGVVYYAIDRTFNFTVNAYDLGETGVTNKRVEAVVTTLEIVYSNSAVAPEVEVTFDGKKLVYGKDYTVTTASVNAGAAVAQVKGLGNFGGSLDVDFTITKAVNEWVSAPNIIRWVYDGFSANVNVITSNPRYMSAQESVAYTVLGSDKKPVNAILTDFHVEGNGVVAAAVAAELARLGQGTYYLTAHLRETANYYELDTSDNPLEFNVIQATNVWLANPSIIQWSYEEFDKNSNRIYAVSKYLDEDDSVLFSITTDVNGLNGVEGLIDFTADNGVVSDAIASLLNKLTVGRYYLVAKVNGTGNYSVLKSEQAIPFDVTKSANAWGDGDDDLVLPSWIVGEYDEAENIISVKPVHGEADIIITDLDGNEYYNSKTGVNNLKAAPVGKYLLTASVAETTNFGALAERTFTIEVFEKAGLPWWATLVIVLGVLLVVAIVILVLWKLKVFEILTGKVALAIRTRATVDATIAAVRATKVAEEGKKSVEAAKRKEAAEERKAKAEEERNKPVEEKAAALEEKAKQAAERAEKMRARAEAMQARAERMREQAQGEKEAAATEESKE